MIKKFPMEKYKFIVMENMVVALSSYAGRTVRGVAKCDPNDNFDVEKGKKLAAARCNERVCRKRLQRASARFEHSAEAMQYWKNNTEKMSKYFEDASTAYVAACDELATLQENM